jgi:2-polyprenyl-6-methoxyphenol hydroxylase-like FAD-dependent oxidoreductase
VESLAAGWLFLLPGDPGHGWLLAVGESPAALLSGSRLVAGQIDSGGEMVRSFPCYPRIVEPLCQPGWLACGTAAVGFDPLCGDGTGYATREAILASAVVRAALDGADVEALSAHYAARLVAGFQRHLEVCRQFYETGGTGPWWRREAEALNRGLDWCRKKLAAAPPFRYRLNGFSLEAVE